MFWLGGLYLIPSIIGGMPLFMTNRSHLTYRFFIKSLYFGNAILIISETNSHELPALFHMEWNNVILTNADQDL